MNKAFFNMYTRTIQYTIVVDEKSDFSRFRI